MLELGNDQATGISNLAIDRRIKRALDGNKDFVTGKRFFAHNGGDPGGMEAAVLYWFEYKPGKEPSWIPHLIDEDSGVGLQVLVEDMNGDGLPDIVSGNKKGVHVFLQER